MKRTIFGVLLLVLMGTICALGQTKVTGKVVDASTKEPIPFASVVVVGTTLGTNTDDAGNFVLSIPTNANTIKFSFVGYADLEEKIEGRTTINVALESTAEALGSAVVIGYGTQSTKRVTTSIASIKADQLKDVPAASLMQAMQGKMSGVQVNTASGRPGAPVMVSVRGRSSINAGNEPLYVIDGVPFSNKDDRVFTTQGQGYSPLANLNSDDIESIDVLKDAAAAAIYGSRGSNGVVLITTKRGKQYESSNISFSAYYGFQSIIKNKDLLNASEYRQMTNESLTNRGLKPKYTPEQVANPEHNVNWMKEIKRNNSYISNYQVSSSGGGKSTSYYASLGYFKQDGLLQKGKFERYSGRLNVDHKYSESFKLGMNMALSRTNRDETSYDNSIYSPWPGALKARPDESIYNKDGSFNDGSYSNPLKMFLPESTLNVSNVLSSVYGELKIIDGLTFRSSLGIDYTLTEQYEFNSSKTFGGEGTNGDAFGADVKRINWIATQTLNYKKSFFNEKLYLDAIAVYEYQDNQYDVMNVRGQNFPSDFTKYLISAAKVITGSTDWSGNRLESMLARVNLSWESKYLLGLSIRRDGSSKFPKDGRIGYFPSISLGWNADQEDFMQNNTIISSLKLRGSFGKTGNQEGIKDFGYFGSYGTSASYNDNPAFVLDALGNPNLKWESTDQYDLGFDIGVLDDRVRLNFDAYLKKTKNLLINKPISPTTGFSSRLENVGSLEGKGLDITIRTTNLKGIFNWTTSLIVSLYSNKVTELHNDEPISGSFVTRHAVGQPLGSFYLIKSLGVNPETGDMIYEDISGNDGKPDGLISDADRQFLGNPLPKVSGGFTNEFSYKGFDLNIFFQYSFGHKLYKMYEDETGGAASLGAATVPVNVLKDVWKDRWTAPGQNAKQPRAIGGDEGKHNTRRSSRFLEDASYVRLKNITLGYTLPKNIVNKLKLQGIRIYVSGQNLLTFTSYSGFDPEISTDVNVANYGVDLGAIPQMKTILFGINLNF